MTISKIFSTRELLKCNSMRQCGDLWQIICLIKLIMKLKKNLKKTRFLTKVIQPKLKRYKNKTKVKSLLR